MGKSLASFAKGVPYYYDDALSPQIGTSLWEDCPIASMMSNPTIGVSYDTQFQSVTASGNAIGGWTTTVATAGTVTVDANLGLKIDAGSTTAAQGINIQTIGAKYKIQANKPIWAEGRFKFTGQTSLQLQFAFGLAAASTTAMIASSAVSTTDFVGFAGVSTSGVILGNATASSTAGTTTGFTVVNNAVFKLGIRAATDGVKFYVNDAPVGSTLTANIPTGFLAPIIVVQSHGTVRPIVFVDRVAYIGLF